MNRNLSNPSDRLHSTEHVKASISIVEVSSVEVSDRLRLPNADAVANLAESMNTVGLLNPITVTSDLRLIAGHHRLLAAKQLGWQTIAACIVEMDSETARIAEIDENLLRNELRALERAEHLAERKRVYEVLHPETRRGVAGALAKSGTATDKLSFANWTSQHLGESARNIRRAVAIVEALDLPTRDAIRNTPIGDNKRELTRLAKLSQQERFAVVAEIANGARSVREAQRNVVANAIRSEAPPMPDGPFRVIVLDPPWEYGKRKSDPSHRAALPYPTMNLDEIAALPIQDLAHRDAVLWLWTTNAFLDGAHKLVEGWGFHVKTMLTWAKDRPGLGDWLRGQTEHTLLAVRGKPVVELSGQSTLLNASRREHSRKPDEFYALVESLCPGSKLELFARQSRPGWTTCGAEADRFSGGE